MYPTDEMRAEMLRLNMRPTDAHDAPAPETWREVNREGLSTENYVTFYHDATEPHIEGDTSFARRILALLGEVCVPQKIAQEWVDASNALEPWTIPPYAAHKRYWDAAKTLVRSLNPTKEEK